MQLILNWLIALAALALFFAGLYIVVKAAVRSAIKEALAEMGKELARRVWTEDGGGQDRPPRN